MSFIINYYLLIIVSHITLIYQREQIDFHQYILHIVYSKLLVQLGS